MSVTWSMQPGSGLGQLSEHGSMVSICTTNAGMYLLDATDAGQPGTPYSRVKFVYDKVQPPPASSLQHPWPVRRRHPPGTSRAERETFRNDCLHLANHALSQGGKEALKELIRFSPLSLTSMGPGSRTILHDVIGEVDLLRSLLAEANLNGVSPTMPFGPQVRRPTPARQLSLPCATAHFSPPVAIPRTGCKLQ